MIIHLSQLRDTFPVLISFIFFRCIKCCIRCIRSPTVAIKCNKRYLVLVNSYDNQQRFSLRIYSYSIIIVDIDYSVIVYRKLCTEIKDISSRRYDNFLSVSYSPDDILPPYKKQVNLFMPPTFN